MLSMSKAPNDSLFLYPSFKMCFYFTWLLEFMSGKQILLLDKECNHLQLLYKCGNVKLVYSSSQTCLSTSNLGSSQSKVVSHILGEA